MALLLIKTKHFNNFNDTKEYGMVSTHTNQYTKIQEFRAFVSVSYNYPTDTSSEFMFMKLYNPMPMNKYNITLDHMSKFQSLLHKVEYESI